MPAAARCALQVARGVDVIKIATTGGVNSRIGAGLGQQMFDDEVAGDRRRPRTCTARRWPCTRTARTASRSRSPPGVDSIEHGTMLDDECLELFRRAGAYYVPTLSTVNGYLERLAADPNAYSPDVRAKVELAHRGHRRGAAQGRARAA